MRSVFCVLFGVLFYLSSVAQEVQVKGFASDFAGKQAVLFRPADPLSGKREVIEIKNIGDDGRFSFKFSISETQTVLVSISRMEGLLFVEPGKNYDVIFPAKGSADVKRFDRTEVILDLSNLEENDLNINIRKFNADYISFISKHYYDFVSDEFKGSDVYRNTLGDKVKKSDLYKMPAAQDTAKKETHTNFPQVVATFSNQMEEKYKNDFSNVYFKNYVRYALAEIKLLSGFNRNLFYREYFHEQPVLYQNTAYIKTFETFYKGFFKTDTNAKIDSLSKLINTHNNIGQLSYYYKKDTTALDKDVRMLALLTNLKATYHDKQYARSAVLRTIQSIASTSSTDFQKQIALNMTEQLKKFDKGYMCEDFTVGDAHDEKWTLSEYVDVPTYLFFFATWNTASVKEMLMLEKLHAAYKNDIQIIGICMDDNYDNFKKYLREHKSQQFKMLYGAGDALLSEKYNVRAIPHAVLLNAKGEWMFSYTRRPSEGVEDDFKRIKINNAKPSQGRKTWKDK